MLVSKTSLYVNYRNGLMLREKASWRKLMLLRVLSKAHYICVTKLNFVSAFNISQSGFLESHLQHYLVANASTMSKLDKNDDDRYRLGGEPLCFNSRSRPPHDKFSNFYEVKIEMAEGCFNSVEHYFQSMKFIDENHSRFEIDGDLGRQGIKSGNWKPTVSKGRFIKSAGSKSGTKTYALTLRSNGLDRERAKRIMKCGLLEKFKKEPFKTLLLETLKRPLVHTPLRGKPDDWTARVNKTSGDIVGQNNMGKLLMEVRKELKEASGGDFGDTEEWNERQDAEIKEKEDEIDTEDNTCDAGDSEGPQVKKKKPNDSGEGD